MSDDVAAARAAVANADAKMDGVVAMLARHYRLGVFALASALVIGVALLYVVVGLRQAQRADAEQAERTAIQIVANEVEVLRHRVHSKEGDLRLCTVALGASRAREVAERICAPVVGPDFAVTKGKLAAEEERLARMRAAR